MTEQQHISEKSALPFRWIDPLRMRADIADEGYLPTYILIFRFLVLLAIPVRFVAYRSEYTGNRVLAVYIIIGLFAVLLIGATFVTWRPALRRSRQIQTIFIIADILVISFFYWLTNNPQSDSFLFYYLPIFAAAEYLSRRSVAVVFGSVTAALFGVCWALLRTNPAYTVLIMFLRVFLPRETFLYIVVATSALIFKDFSSRHYEMENLLYFKSEADKLFDVDDILELAARHAVNCLKADASEVFLLNRGTFDSDMRKSFPSNYYDDAALRLLVDAIAKQAMVASTTDKATSHRPVNASRDPRLSSVLCVPITIRRGVLGAFLVTSANKDQFSEGARSLLKNLGGHAASAIERARLLTTLGNIATATPTALDLDQQLDFVLDRATDALGFDYAVIYLIDACQDVIDPVRGRRVPISDDKRVRHNLDSGSAEAVVARSGKTLTISQVNAASFDSEGGAFERANVTRVFVPIKDRDSVIGTIEAGVNLESAANLALADAVRELELLGLERGMAIARTRPHVLLQMIADSVIDIIGADSASLHVYEKVRTTESTDSAGEGASALMVAGAGRADKEFLREFAPRSNGLGRQAISSGNTLTLDTGEEVLARSPLHYQRGIRSMLATPLSLGERAEGVLYIHFWEREYQLNQAERELISLFSQEMARTIQNHLLVDNMTQVLQRAWVLADLQNFMHSLTSTFDLRRVLEMVAESARRILDADIVTLYVYIASESRFEVPPVMDGKFYHKELMHTSVGTGDTPTRIITLGRPLFVDAVEDEDVLSTPHEDGRERFIARERIRSCAALVLRAGEKRENVGLLFVNYRKAHRFSLEDKKVINALAAAAALVIRTARLHEAELRKRNLELQAMHAVYEAISAGPADINGVLEELLRQALRITGAEYGRFLKYNQWNQTLESMPRWVVPAGRSGVAMHVGDGIIGRAAQTKQFILVSDVRAEPWDKIYREVNAETRSELAVPVIDSTGGLLGVFNVESSRVNAFRLEHQSLLAILAVQAVVAVHSVDLYSELERQLKALRALGVILTRIQHAEYDLQTILYLLLTGITAEEGLGFSRAMLFLLKGQGEFLQGELAIGAVAAEEASATWDRMQKERDYVARDGDALVTILDAAESASRHKTSQHEALNKAVAQVRLPIANIRDAPLVSIAERRAIAISSREADSFRTTKRQLATPDSVAESFACVPVTGKQGCMGVLVVDNRFLPTEMHDISKASLSSLQAFAQVMAMSIENHQLRGGEVLETIIHELRAPAAALRTHVSYLKRHFTTLSDSELTNALDRMALAAELILLQASETERFLGGKAREPIRQRTVVYRDVIMKAANQLRELVQLSGYDFGNVRYGSSDAGRIVLYVDPARLNEVVLNLLINSIKYAEDDPTTFAIQIDLEETHEQLIIKFKDWGMGIKSEYKDHIFERGFRAPEARAMFVTGSGLGLAISREIMRELGGDLRLANLKKPTEFHLALPKTLMEAPGDPLH